MFSFLKIVLQYWNTSDGALKNINNIYMYNNQNNVATFETETHSQQQSQTTPSAPSIPSPGKLRILQRNENTSSLTPKKRSEPLCTKQGRNKRGPKPRYTANTKHRASINHVQKAISRT